MHFFCNASALASSCTIHSSWEMLTVVTGHVAASSFSLLVEWELQDGTNSEKEDCKVGLCKGRLAVTVGGRFPQSFQGNKVRAHSGLIFRLFFDKPVHTKHSSAKCLEQIVVWWVNVKCLPSSLRIAWIHFLRKAISFVNWWNVTNLDTGLSGFSPLWFPLDLHCGTQQEWGIMFTLPNSLVFMYVSQWRHRINNQPEVRLRVGAFDVGVLAHVASRIQ